ncbi:hypothetical protein BH11ARM1_BH11ARM1_04050 [soil metagenome]
MINHIFAAQLLKLSRPAAIRDIIFALLRITPHDQVAGYLRDTLTWNYDVRAALNLLQGIGFLDGSMEPTAEWQEFVAADEHARRDLLRAALEEMFRAPDGSSATHAAQTIPKVSDRIDWYVRHHGLQRSTQATYAERLYREALKAFTAPLPLPPHLTREHSAPSHEVIRAVLKDNDHGMELVFYLPDSADSKVHEKVFKAANDALFSEDGRWAPLDRVTSMSVTTAPADDSTQASQ